MALKISTLLSIPILPVGKGKTIPDIHIVPQVGNYLCWAACAAMVLAYRKIDFKAYCNLVGFTAELGLHSENCCQSPNPHLPFPADCDQPLKPEEITLLWKKHGIKPDDVLGQIGIDLIIKELNKDSPVEIAFGPKNGADGNGHAVIIYEWLPAPKLPGGIMFSYLDPASGVSGWTSSSGLISGDEDEIWNATWTHLVK